VGFCELGNENSVSIKDGEFLDWLCDCGLLKNYYLYLTRDMILILHMFILSLNHKCRLYLFFIFISEIHDVIKGFIIKSRRMRWAVHVARMREMRNTYTVLVGRPEGKGSLGSFVVDGKY
jgi:hypothetical protein